MPLQAHLSAVPDPARRQAFETDGIVRVPAVLGGDELRAMRDHVAAIVAAGALELVDLVGARRPGPGTEAILWDIGRAPAFAPLAPALARAVDDVFGPGVWAPIDGGLAAPNLPGHAAPWTVPHAAWHVDEPTVAGQVAGWALLGFVFLDTVEPGGGATVAIAGSHRRLAIVAAERAAAGAATVLTTDDALAELRREPWFAALLTVGEPADRRRRFMAEPYVSAGIPLRVVELTGEPGDVVLMDPRCLHTISANASPRARLTMRITCGRLT